jgi:phage repressor protein C with HTH and peptisase S24 domain
MKTDVGRRIAELLEQKSQGNMSALARHVGVSPQAVYQWIAGETSPRGANLVKVAEFFGVSPAYIQYGEGTKPAPADEPAPSQTPSPKYLRLEKMDVEASAGHGATVSSEPEIVDRIDVLAEWAHRQLGHAATVPGRVRLITARGTSMSPTIENGDLLFVDTAVQHYDAEAIYVIARPYVGLQVKRLQMMAGGKLAILSDNQAYVAEYLSPEDAEQVRICGRVLGSWTLRKFWT